MVDLPPRLILASRSPRRRRLLKGAGYEFEVVPPRASAECGVGGNETPSQFVARLAYQKAEDVARRLEHGLVLGCDTVAECRGTILGKPRDEQHARQMLRMLRGSVHRVLSGVCLWQRPDDYALVKADSTELQMDPLPDEQLEAYLDSQAWQGKAGAFGYQDGFDWIRILKGSASNVVGLPMELLADMLSELTLRR